MRNEIVTSGIVTFTMYALTALLCLMPLRVEAEDAVRIASDEWCPFVCAANGKLEDGYLVELTEQALGLSGIYTEPVLMPLNRAMVQAATGKVEGVYAPVIDDRLILSMALGYSRACFYTLTSADWHYHGIASLTNISFGIIDGYGYDNAVMDEYIARNRKSEQRLFSISYGETAGTENVKKLLANRYLAMLEHEAVMTRLTAQLHAEGKIRNAGCLDVALPLTVGFARNNDQSPSWIRSLDEGYERLLASGRLTELQKRYNITPAELAPAQESSTGGKAHRAK